MLPIHTAHLTIRYLTLADAGFMLELLNDPGYIRHIADRGIRTLADAERYLANGPLQSYQQYGYGLFMVVEQDTGLPAGLCGLIFRPYIGIPDVGYAFLPAFRGKGYAYEAASAVKNWGHNQQQLPQIVGICNRDNLASVRILEQLGLMYEKDIVIPDNQKTVCLFS